MKLILRLTIKKKWFDMIKAGIKKEEYREIKPHWIDRLTDQRHWWDLPQHTWKFSRYDAVEFINGYSKTAPRIMMECSGITIGEGNQDWGAEPGSKYFIIHLGERINASEQKDQTNG